jgi:hypothetical protein
MTLDQKRWTLVIGATFVAIVWNVAAWKLGWGWPAVAILTFALIGIFCFLAWRWHDPILSRLLLFGVPVGISTLPCDAWAMVRVDTLCYPHSAPWIWDSAFYMPFAYIPMMAMLGWMGCWALEKWGLLVASVLCFVLGSVNIPLWEYLAQHAGYWLWGGCSRGILDVPLWVIASEGALTATLPLFLKGFLNRSAGVVIALGFAEGLWIWVSSHVAWNYFCGVSSAFECTL